MRVGWGDTSGRRMAGRCRKEAGREGAAGPPLLPGHLPEGPLGILKFLFTSWQQVEPCGQGLMVSTTTPQLPDSTLCKRLAFSPSVLLHARLAPNCFSQPRASSYPARPELCLGTGALRSHTDTASFNSKP